MYRAITKVKGILGKKRLTRRTSLMGIMIFFSEFPTTRRLPEVNICPELDEICDQGIKKFHSPITWISCVRRRL